MAKCIRLEWVKEPNIPACAIGEPADFRDLQIRAVYDDGSKQEMDVILKMFNEFTRDRPSETGAGVLREKEASCADPP